jgi:hypothetical protein
MQVHTLINPTLEQFREAQQAVHPVFLYLQGQQQENEEEIGTLVWGDTDLSDPQMFVSLITPPFPTMVSPKLFLNRLIACICCYNLQCHLFLTGGHEVQKCTSMYNFILEP